MVERARTTEAPFERRLPLAVSVAQGQDRFGCYPSFDGFAPACGRALANAGVWVCPSASAAVVQAALLSAGMHLRLRKETDRLSPTVFSETRSVKSTGEV